MVETAAVGYWGGVRRDVLRMGAISMGMALGVYGLPLLLDQSLAVAGRGLNHTGPLLTIDRMFFLAASGIMMCMVILPLIGLILGVLGMYRQKKEVELSFLASIMHGTLLTVLCCLMQDPADMNICMQIVQIAMAGVV